MRSEVIRASDLDAEHVALWNSFRGRVAERGSSGPCPLAHAGDSPFLHPAYAQTLGRRRDRVQVCVLEDGGQVVGFFPFERHRSGVGRPAGGRVCDVQAVIAREGYMPKPEELKNACGVRVLHFEQLLAPQTWVESAQLPLREARHIDLSRGFEAYAEDRKEAGSNQIRQTARKRRKIEREVGDVQFEWHTSDDGVFRQLLEWKKVQRRATGSFDVLQFRWVVDSLDRIRQAQTEDFAGVLSALRVGGRLAAVHLGMRTRTALHHWFTAYNAELHKYSPGLILLVNLTQEAARRGIRRIDVGRGDEEWKKSFASFESGVAHGAIDSRPLHGVARAGMLAARRWTAASSGWSVLQPARRWLRSVYLRRLMG
jgi:CelD/BcsL family acetyltransferase involved in cellulose biosynthesis